jgi:hypothetical protein
MEYYSIRPTIVAFSNQDNCVQLMAEISQLNHLVKMPLFLLANEISRSSECTPSKDLYDTINISNNDDII